MRLKYRLKGVFPPADAPDAVGSERQVLTVSELTHNIRFTLEEKFTSIWVEGQISNFKFHSSGHMYFSIKDEEAQLACVMFRQSNASLNFEMSDGMQVVCFGRVSVYGPRGQYQLYVERVEPKGVGALQIRFEQLKEKLRKEGFFDEAVKKEIPFLPSRVAIVTSMDTAALRDILNVLERRFSSAHLLIYPVPVQGNTAAPRIAEAIADLNEQKIADVMILARGGGSLEDLWAFNEEIVARAIFHSEIPVISAIGHETDFTIADFVADLRAPTPSAAAELVLPRREDLLLRIDELVTRSAQAMKSSLEARREALKVFSKARVLRDPLQAFELRIQRVGELSKSLTLAAKQILQSKRQEGARLVGQLESLGPVATLKRGFSVTIHEANEKVITKTTQVRVGEKVLTKLADGSFTSTITEVRHGGR